MTKLVKFNTKKYERDAYPYEKLILINVHYGCVKQPTQIPQYLNKFFIRISLDFVKGSHIPTE